MDRGSPSRRSLPSVPGLSALTRVVVYPPTHLLRSAEPQEFALGPRPPRPDQGRRSSSKSPTAGRRAEEFALGPRPQHPDQCRRSSPYPPTVGRRAAGVHPRSPATAPRPGSLFLLVPTNCGPWSCGSSPSVPGHSAPTKVVVPLRTHPLRAAEAQEFALGPWPQRPDQGRLSTPNPPTADR